MRFPKRALTVTAASLSLLFAGAGAASAATEPAVQVTEQNGQFTLSAPVTAQETGFRHTFSKEETQFLFDTAKAGGETAVTAGCQVLVPAPANAACPTVAKFFVGLVAKPFEPKGRCLAVWAVLEEQPPIGARYVTC
ncbi:hypothetical protein [Amycolatopsis anabasis]|uniref:hypothetical protein n=1 Tax=Amycolatopsis anabasis TaxID=1840409 RepID=UPI00131C9FEB|nr:hypothetical protein [Amycolatopsis anabasis]